MLKAQMPRLKPVFTVYKRKWYLLAQARLQLQQEEKQVDIHPLGACDGIHEEGSELYFPCVTTIFHSQHLWIL